MNLAGLGIWTAQFDFQPASIVHDTVQELEEMGYASIWIGENVGREPISQSALLLAATQRMIVATGVANIWARDPLSAFAAQQTLSEVHPDRFVLGLGVSHLKLVDGARGLHYGQPIKSMRDYLSAMDRLGGRYRAVRPEATTTVIAALGPAMIRLAAAMADGAHTYLVNPEHTGETRNLLGRDALLVVEQAVVLEPDKVLAYEIGRRHLRRYLDLPNYTTSFLRAGFSVADLENGGSDRLVESLIAWGDEERISQRLIQHRQAGADGVCIQVLGRDFRELPRAGRCSATLGTACCSGGSGELGVPGGPKLDRCPDPRPY